MNFLVTGGAGFIGSHLCESLLSDSNNKVYCLDNFCDFYEPETKKQNISTFLKNENFELLEGDIRDEGFLEEVFEKKIDMVIHLAAMAGVRPSIDNPKLYSDVNIRGTVNILEKCKQNSVDKFIFASSSSVYGNNKKVPFAENDCVDYPISPYASTKKSGELICYNYSYLYKISMICLRFFTVYGPRQRPDLAIHKFAKLMITGKKIDFYGDGTTKRDYTYITDILDGILKSIDYLKCNQKVYEILNLGESKTISLKYMVKTLESVMGVKAVKNYKNLFPGDVIQTFADITKSKRLIGYNPTTSFEDGIKTFVKWLKKQRGSI